MQSDVSEMVRSLLMRRGITDEKEVTAFLSPEYELHTHAPELLIDMELATDRVLKAIENNERIAIYSDFDCDGIPGAALASDFFEKIQYTNFEIYLPHRDREGYGFHTEAIDQLASRNVKLIITIDVGTTAVEAVAHAKSKGIDVIVCDHHEIVSELPDAIAVLNPKRPSTSSGQATYPFKDLCGAAVAFKFVQALLKEGKKRKIERFEKIQDGWEKWLLDLVAIATIADMVPLVGENRVLAFWGLSVLRKSPRPGIVALCTSTRLRRSQLTEDDIGFSIAPRINAASRMDEPDLAFKLLTTHDRNEAEQLASQLETLNSSRKGVVGGIVKQARKHVVARYQESDRVVVLGNTEWKPALLGLAANSIMQDRGGVVCLWGRDALGRLKGSCRSDGRVSVVDLFANAGTVLEEYGGHAASGGFSVSHEQVHTLGESLSKAAALCTNDVSKGIESTYDAEVTLREISYPLYRDVTRLAPFGARNPKPLFKIGRTIVTSVRAFGKEKGHIELMLECRESGAHCRAFEFFKSAEDFTQAPSAGSEVSILGTLERDSFRGGLSVRIRDVLPAQL